MEFGSQLCIYSGTEGEEHSSKLCNKQVPTSEKTKILTIISTNQFMLQAYYEKNYHSNENFLLDLNFKI